MSTPTSATITVRTPDDIDAAAVTLVEVHHGDGYPVEGVEHPTA